MGGHAGGYGNPDIQPAVQDDRHRHQHVDVRAEPDDPQRRGQADDGDPLDAAWTAWRHANQNQAFGADGPAVRWLDVTRATALLSIAESLARVANALEEANG